HPSYREHLPAQREHAAERDEQAHPQDRQSAHSPSPPRFHGGAREPHCRCRSREQARGSHLREGGTRARHHSPSPCSSSSETCFPAAAETVLGEQVVRITL